MPLDSEIIIVSGLPRSGTSLMMQMLHAGGVEVVTDQVREADIDNPRGYLEFERVKQIERDASWLPETRGKAFKMISQLLYHLPPTERYRIIFMWRNVDEILASQEKMLRRRNAPAAPREKMKEAYALHLDKLFEWLQEQAQMEMLVVNYNDLLGDAMSHAEAVSKFLDGAPPPAAMAKTVDPTLYRNQSATTQV